MHFLTKRNSRGRVAGRGQIPLCQRILDSGSTPLPLRSLSAPLLLAPTLVRRRDGALATSTAHSPIRTTHDQHAEEERRKEGETAAIFPSPPTSNLPRSSPLPQQLLQPP